MEQTKIVAKIPSIIGDKVEVQLFTTLKCNIRCTYCVMGVGDVLDSQGRASYSIDELERFVDTHLSDKEVYFTFFGGEPLLNRPFVDAVMARFPKSRYQLQTNGTLLSKLPAEQLARFSNFLISVDGGRAITDKYRGNGTYDRVMKNVQSIKDKVTGTLTARVTWADPEATYQEMRELLDVFDLLHFQFAQQDGVYRPEHVEIKKRVIDEMIADFYAHDGVLGIVPVMGVARNIAIPEAAKRQCGGETQCRVSTNLINVRPDGRIFGCPDMTWEESMEHGSIKENRLARSPLQRHHAMPCGSCEAASWCRSNCLKNLHVAYVLNDKKYREEVVEPVCELVRHFGRRIAEGNPKAWLERLSEKDRHYVEHAEIYDFVEITP